MLKRRWNQDLAYSHTYTIHSHAEKKMGIWLKNRYGQTAFDVDDANSNRTLTTLKPQKGTFHRRRYTHTKKKNIRFSSFLLCIVQYALFTKLMDFGFNYEKRMTVKHWLEKRKAAFPKRNHFILCSFFFWWIKLIKQRTWTCP